MGILQWSGKVFTSVINIRVDRWLGASYIKYTIGQIANILRLLFIPAQADQQESFEASLKRLNITDEELKAKESEFARLFVFYLFLSLVIFSYSILLFHKGNWGGGFMSLCIVLYPLGLAFRFHFWLFQIRKRKLGCSLKEWWNSK